MEKQINLTDLNDLLNNKQKYFHSRQESHQGVPSGYDGNQGEYNEYFKFYNHPGLPKGVFLKETYRTDSYGYGDFLIRIDFVEGKEKTITVFESIN